jgi:hypothetical protein
MAKGREFQEIADELILNAEILCGLAKNNEGRMSWRHFGGAFVLILLFSGCSAHVDNMSKFHIKGMVKDRGTGEPVEGATLYFTDTGFDYVQSRILSAQQLGHSDSNGKLSLQFDYMWGMNKSLFSKEPPQTFILDFEHAAYQSFKIPLRAGDFSVINDQVQIDLGIINLTKRTPASSIR